jgi:membrane protein
LLSIGLVVAAFTFVYLYIPNTRVPWRAALLGGTVGGLAWKLAGFVFAHFISTSASYHAIYSSLVIVILFMIWLDLSWLILLLGGQAAMYFQHPQYLQGFERFQELGSRLREGLGLSLMVLIARRFVENRPPWSIDELAEQVALPWVTVKDALEVLRRGGLIEETNRAVESFLPARDIAGITVREVLGVMRSGMDDELLQCEIRCLSPQARQVLAELEQHATQSRAARLTLRELALANGR